MYSENPKLENLPNTYMYSICAEKRLPSLNLVRKLGIKFNLTDLFTYLGLKFKLSIVTFFYHVVVVLLISFSSSSSFIHISLFTVS